MPFDAPFIDGARSGLAGRSGLGGGGGFGLPVLFVLFVACS